MPKRASKRPRDPNQLAKLIVDMATGERRPSKSKGARKSPKRPKSRKTPVRKTG